MKNNINCILIFILFSISLSFVLSAEGRAEGLITPLIEAVSNTSVVKTVDIVYILGGNNEEEVTKTIWGFSPETGEWKNLPGMLEARTGHCACYYDGRIYLFGGLNREMKTLDSVESMDIKTGEWRQEGVMPVARARFALASFGDKIYLFGGSNEENPAMNSVLEFNFRAGKWTEKKELPVGANRLSAATTMDGNLYVAGGEDASGKTLASVYTYNPQSDTFTESLALNHPRKNFAIASFGNFILVAGGWDEKEGEKIFLSSTEIFNPDTKKWEDGPALSEGRDGCRGYIWKDSFIVLGGYNGSLLVSVEEINLDNFTSGWKIDEELKFHLAYLPAEENELSKGGEVETPLSQGYTEDYLPDISNINLAAITGLGFPLPAVDKAEDYNLYLKLYEFPESFEVLHSTFPVMEDYFFDKMDKRDILRSFVKSSGNVAVKKAFIERSDKVFTPDDPFPPLRVSADDPQAQGTFNSNIRFYSLYLNPEKAKENFATHDELARWSAEGVLAFHRELIDVYCHNLVEVSGLEPDRYFYFLDKDYSGEAEYIYGQDCIAIIKVPRKAMVFDNWRDLPMPADPKHMFLSGLLLLYRTVYVPAEPGEAETIMSFPVESPEFLEATGEACSTVFEVGSVVRVP